jgi:hypothetical protein
MRDYVTEYSFGLMLHAELHDFLIGNATLAVQHQVWLAQRLVPLLKRGGWSISVIGQASRTGSEAANQGLSEQRADAVRLFLEQQCGKCFQFAYFGGMGERSAMLAGERDGTEDGRFRSVVILAHARSQPPKPEEIKRPVHHTPEPSEFWIGFGEGHSADLVLIGAYDWNARIYRMRPDSDGETEWAELSANGLKVGPGLGGSGDAILLFARGVKHPSQFDEARSWSGADFDLAFGGEFGAAIKTVRTLGKIVKGVEHWGKLRYAGEQLIKNKAFIKPGLYIIPIPGAGAGMHVWAGKKYGVVNIIRHGSARLPWN